MLLTLLRRVWEWIYLGGIVNRTPRPPDPED